MSLRERLTRKILSSRWVAGAVEQKVEERLQAAAAERVQAVHPAAQERLPAAVDSYAQEIGWRKLTGNDTRQLPMMTQDRQIEVSYWLWKTNPLGAWIINITVAFVTGKGLPFNCEDEEVRKVLERFWKTNRLKRYWRKWVRELGIYGELCLPAFVSEQVGMVRLGYIDPAHIDHTITDPHNVMVKIGIKLKDGGRGAVILKTILDPETEAFLSDEAKDLRETFTGGACFYFSVNDLTNEPRGTSDLFTIADHIDNYEQFLFDSGEKYAQFNAFFWDVTVKGADEAKLKENRDLYRPPRTGEAFIHNENVTAEAVAPDMKSVDAEKAARLHRNHILGSRGLPEHWYGGGGDVNRATAAEMDAPAISMIEERQDDVLAMLEQILDFVILSAVDSGYLMLPPDIDPYAAYELQKPELDKGDIAKFATALQQIAGALVVAQTNGWIDEPKARAAFAFACSFVGYKYDAEDVDEVPPEGADYKTGKTAPEIPAAPPEAAEARENG